MKLRVYRNLWGLGSPTAAIVESLARKGYDGIETILWDESQRRALRPLLARHALDFRGVIWTKGVSVADHVRSFREQLGVLRRLGPSGFTVIGGYDCWSEADTDRYYEAVLRIEEGIDVPVAHELHRNTCLFHPAPARRILGRFPELKLVCDFSHWVVTCERLLGDQEDLIRLCGRHAVHIHTRVGNEESPQVADVRAPEAKPYRDAFESWWRVVWEEQARRGLKQTSVCAEFGAPPYQQTLPYTGMPVADLEAICDWQTSRQRTCFEEWQSQSLRRKVVPVKPSA